MTVEPTTSGWAYTWPSIGASHSWPKVLPATASGDSRGWLPYQPSRRSPPLLVIPAAAAPPAALRRTARAPRSAAVSHAPRIRARAITTDGGASSPDLPRPTVRSEAPGVEQAPQEALRLGMLRRGEH